MISVSWRGTAAGRRFYAVGVNPRAASLNQVRVRGYWVLVFGLSAALAVLVGTALAGFAGGDPNAGSPYLFESLAAVVIGGYGRDRHLRNKV
ncbi:ABC transporter permease subunit [Amycolatopsis jiangsuensis]|uniref:ABC transporter permease subunit n=1 Tax=Amycolatopsis jiangsuensis TaxID=1181879 RepID=UPI001622251F|nr:hypothetical protein [Amycolatopsis jiangsuensis]